MRCCKQHGASAAKGRDQVGSRCPQVNASWYGKLYCPCTPVPNTWLTMCACTPTLAHLDTAPPNLFSHSLWMLLSNSTPRNINLTVSSSVPGYSN